MKHLRYIVGFALLLAANFCFAAGTSHFDFLTPLQCKINGGQGGICDFSVTLLGQVFGTIHTGSSSPAALPGAGSLALGWMFSIFNKGICAVIGLFTAYGVFTYALRAAHDGMQGQRQKGAMMLLRVVIGVSLLLPQTGTGYSLMQSFVMDAAVYGAGLADAIYGTVLDHMAEGATTLFNQVSSKSGTSSMQGYTRGIDVNNINKIVHGLDNPSQTGSQAHMLKNMFLSAMCTESSKVFAKNRSHYVSSLESSINQIALPNSATFLKGMNPAFAAMCKDQGDSQAFCGRSIIPASDRADLISKMDRWLDGGSDGGGYKQVILGINPKQASNDLQINDQLMAKDHTLSFPGYGKSGAYDAKACGSYTLNPVGKNPVSDITAGPFSQTAEDMQALAKTVVANYAQPVKQPLEIVDAPIANLQPHFPTHAVKILSLRNSMGQTAVDYANLMLPYLHAQKNKGQIDSKTGLSTFVQDAKVAGWTTAGRYYFDIIRLNNFIQSYESSANGDVTGVPQPTLAMDSDYPAGKPYFDQKNQWFWPGYIADSGLATSVVKDLLSREAGNTDPGSFQQNRTFSGANGFVASDNTDNHQYAPKTGTALDKIKLPMNSYKLDQSPLASMFVNDNSSIKGKMQSAMNAMYAPMGIGEIIIRPMISAMGNIASFFDKAADTANPIVFTHEIGMVALMEPLKALMIINGLIFITTLAASVCFAQSPLGEATSQSLNWAGGMVKVMLGPLLMAGGVCAYWMPLYPFMVFTFGVISWLISIIDGMIAMPLVCLGLAHPDGGHELLGKAETAMMLLVGIFIRPAVMIFAMIAAIAVSYVGMRLLNVGFLGVLVDGFGSGMHMVTTRSGDNIHQSMLISKGGTASFLSATTSVFAGDKVAGALGSHGMHGNYAISKDKSAQANGGVEYVSKAVMAALNGAKYDAGYNALGFAVLPIVAVPILFVIYAMMVYSLITMSFGMVSELVQGVLRWVGGPQIADNSAQIASKIQGAVGDVGGKVSGMAGESLSGAQITAKFDAAAEKEFSGSGGAESGGAESGGAEKGGEEGKAGGSNPPPA